jgi:transcriptional regulator with XRE-family HTH domain
MTAKPKWSAADRARHAAIRQEFAHCPTQEELEATGEYEGPIRSGAYFAVKFVVHELKKAREAADLTLAAVSKLTGMDQATLSRLENGRQPNPTVDTLWRYATAVGRRLVLTHAGPNAAQRQSRPERRSSAIRSKKSRGSDKLGIERFLEQIDEWKFKVHEELKGLNPGERKAYWKRIRGEARARGLTVVEPDNAASRPTRRVRRSG